MNTNKGLLWQIKNNTEFSRRNFLNFFIPLLYAHESTMYYKSTYKSIPNVELGLRVDFKTDSQCGTWFASRLSIWNSICESTPY